MKATRAAPTPANPVSVAQAKLAEKRRVARALTQVNERQFNDSVRLRVEQLTGDLQGLAVERHRLATQKAHLTQELTQLQGEHAEACARHTQRERERDALLTYLAAVGQEQTPGC